MNWRIPEWAARPAVVLATLVALAGAAGIFWSAASGDYWWAVWGGVAFVVATGLWYLSDLAGAPAQPGLE